MHWVSLITQPEGDPDPLHLRWLPEYEVWGVSYKSKPPAKFSPSLATLFENFSLSSNVVVVVHMRRLPIDLIPQAEADCKRAGLIRVPIGADPVEFALSVDSVMMTRNETGEWVIELAFCDK